MDFAHDRHAVLGFGVVDRVPTSDDKAALVRNVLASEQHVAQEIVREFLSVPAHEVEPEDRSAAHRVNVADSICSRDPAPVARIVDHRCDEVGGDDEGAFVREAVDRSIVAAGRPNEQVR